MFNKLINGLFNLSEKQCYLVLVLNLIVITFTISYGNSNVGKFSGVGALFFAVFSIAFAIWNFSFLIRTAYYGWLISITWFLILLISK